MALDVCVCMHVFTRTYLDDARVCVYVYACVHLYITFRSKRYAIPVSMSRCALAKHLKAHKRYAIPVSLTFCNPFALPFATPWFALPCFCLLPLLDRHSFCPVFCYSLIATPFALPWLPILANPSLICFALLLPFATPWSPLLLPCLLPLLDRYSFCLAFCHSFCLAFCHSLICSCACSCCLMCSWLICSCCSRSLQILFLKARLSLPAGDCPLHSHCVSFRYSFRLIFISL